MWLAAELQPESGSKRGYSDSTDTRTQTRKHESFQSLLIHFVAVAIHWIITCHQLYYKHIDLLNCGRPAHPDMAI